MAGFWGRTSWRPGLPTALRQPGRLFAGWDARLGAQLAPWATLAGRVLLSQIFLMSAVSKLLDWQGTLHAMTLRSIVVPAPLLVAAVIFELVGGLSLLLGFKTRLG